jgi:hypothetical protein
VYNDHSFRKSRSRRSTLEKLRDVLRMHYNVRDRAANKLGP